MTSLKGFTSLLRQCMIACLAFAAMGAAHAAPAFTISNTTGEQLTNPPFTLGWTFTTTGPITLTHLGIFDSEQNGLAEAHAIGLWRIGGTLLASTTVAAGTANPLVNQFRYADITDVMLEAGTYTVGALYASGADTLIFPGRANDFAMAAGLVFNTANFAPGDSLTYPEVAFGTAPAYFGPNFLFNAETTAVPEPATLTLFAAALLGLARRRQQR